MGKITPEMLASEKNTLTLPKYDWEKQARINAFGTYASTNSGSWTGSGNGSRYDSSTDSVSD